MKLEATTNTDDAVEYSTKELAEIIGVGDVAAKGFITVMEKLGQAKLSRKRPQPNGRGMPTNIYWVSQKVVLTFKEAQQQKQQEPTCPEGGLPVE